MIKDPQKVKYGRFDKNLKGNCGIHVQFSEGQTLSETESIHTVHKHWDYALLRFSHTLYP